MPIDPSDSNSRKRKTCTLNTTINPEEKRKIIGDTFMKVSVRIEYKLLESKLFIYIQSWTKKRNFFF